MTRIVIPNNFKVNQSLPNLDNGDLLFRQRLLSDNEFLNHAEGESLKTNAWKDFVEKGDEASFKMLFKRYHKQMYGYGLKMCNHPELVKDCIQDLFKTMWEKRDKLNHIESPNVYLFVCLRRMILKSLKKDKRIQNDYQELNENIFFCFGIEEVIITDETKQQQKKALLKALNQLSARQREVIWLFFYNGMSYEEIEEILCIKRQSVRNLMFRSMETLRVLLKDKEMIKMVISLMISFLFYLPHSF